jgi:hypothetical protein
MQNKKNGPPPEGKPDKGASMSKTNNILLYQNHKVKLSETENEVFYEKAGAFIADGHTVEQADVAALNLIFNGGVNGVLLRAFGFDTVLHLAEKCGVHFIPCDPDGRPALKWAGENQKNFTSDIEKLKAWHKQGYRRFSYLPGLLNLVGLDIDCGHADGRDGIEDFYRVIEGLAGKTKNRLPGYFRNIPDSFPCYAETPSGGFHLLLRYSGKCKTANLVYEGAKIEVKYLNSMLSLGEKQNGVYVLRGKPDDAPEMPRFFAELINPPPKPKPAPVTYYGKQRLNLEKILDKILIDSAGNNDRQKKFAWRAAYFGYGIEEVLSFVKSRPDIFGSGADTETVVNHAWRSNTSRASA